MTQTLSPQSTTARVSHADLSPADFFLHELRRQMPRSYILANGNIHLCDRSGKPGMSVCSPLQVSALVRDDNGQGWSRLIQVLTPDRRVIDCVVPHTEVEARPNDAIARLADCGLQIQGDRYLFLQFLKSWRPTHYALRLPQVGWTPDRTAFALADGRVIAPVPRGETVIYTGTADRTTSGCFEDWQSGMAALALGNPYLLFGISLALSGPFLGLTHRTGAIFHLYGENSVGKTKALLAGNTVWPSAGTEVTWNTTSAGLEGQLVQANDTFLGLDELPGEPHPSFGDDIYAAANGAGKNRATVTGRSQVRQQWRAPVLSTGEAPVRQVLRDLGLPLRGGQAVRMIDIPVMGMAHGAFDDLHGHATSKAFSRKIESIAPRDCGHAGAALVHELILSSQNQSIRTSTETLHEIELAKLCHQLGLDPQTARNETLRVLDRFALVAVAGEFASQRQITGWPAGTASEAVMDMAVKWFEHSGADKPTEQNSAIERTRDYLLQYGDSRFGLLRQAADDPVDAPAARSHEAAGYRDDDYFYMLKPTFDTIHRGQEASRAAEKLEAAGYLEPGGERNSRQFALSGVRKQRIRVYRIRAEILSA